jgi:hypothetical protein
MPKKNSYITITDQFCGAGGSSQGAKKAIDKIGEKLHSHSTTGSSRLKLTIQTFQIPCMIAPTSAPVIPADIHQQTS